MSGVKADSCPYLSRPFQIQAAPHHSTHIEIQNCAMNCEDPPTGFASVRSATHGSVYPLSSTARGGTTESGESLSAPCCSHLSHFLCLALAFPPQGPSTRSAGTNVKPLPKLCEIAQLQRPSNSKLGHLLLTEHSQGMAALCCTSTNSCPKAPPNRILMC